MNRKIAPNLTPINQIDLIVPKQINLGNEVDLFLINDVPDSTVKLDIIWNAGSKYQDKPLVASFCNHLLMSGNESSPANQIADQIDSLGGFISHSIHKDHAGFSLFGLVDSIESIFNVVSNSFKHVTFPKTEIEKWKEIKKKEFELNEEKVSVNARKLFTQNIFGKNHHYGKLANLQDFDRVNQTDLQAFFSKNYILTKPSFFIVGNVSDAFIDTLKQFATVFSKSKNVDNYHRPKDSTNQIYEQKEGAVQSAIRIGKLCIEKKDPDFVAFQVLNTVLGGYFGSRLMANIREDKGYTYGIGSGISVLKDCTYFFISTEVAKEKRTATLTEIYYEIEKLQSELISENELAVVKNYMLGSFLRNSDGAIAMMEKHKSKYLQNLSDSYYNDYISGINAITPKKLREVARRHLNQKDFTEISYG